MWLSGVPRPFGLLLLQPESDVGCFVSTVLLTFCLSLLPLPSQLQPPLSFDPFCLRSARCLWRLSLSSTALVRHLFFLLPFFCFRSSMSASVATCCDLAASCTARAFACEDCALHCSAISHCFARVDGLVRLIIQLLVEELLAHELDSGITSS